MRCAPVVAALAAFGCSSVGSSAVRTDGGFVQKNFGEVRIYAVTPPQGTRVIGFIEVHAVNAEANVERLMPVFKKRVADIGGSGGVVDHVLTGYELRTDYRVEHYSYPCGYRGTCWSTRVVPYTYEIRILSIQGRALLPLDAPGPAAVPDQGPAAPIAPGKVLPPATRPDETPVAPPPPAQPIPSAPPAPAPNPAPTNTPPPSETGGTSL